ncbi:MAG: hypothetical protein JXR68_14255 [Bacteroidales bacterium]|nr:hypothetical protein [Bacteroidales bacterium]
MKTEPYKYKLISCLCDVEIVGKKERILKSLLTVIEQSAMFYHVLLKKTKQPEQRQLLDYIILIANNNLGMQTILPELYHKIKDLQNQ